MYGCDMSRHAALSPSRAKDFKQCPLMFRFRTVDRLPEPPSLEALRGTLVHSVLEHLYDGPAAARTPRGFSFPAGTRIWSPNRAIAIYSRGPRISRRGSAARARS